jgi:hypothetical protein
MVSLILSLVFKIVFGIFLATLACFKFIKSELLLESSRSVLMECSDSKLYCTAYLFVCRFVMLYNVESLLAQNLSMHKRILTCEVSMEIVRLMVDLSGCIFFGLQREIES